MKHSVGLFYVVVATACFGSTLGDNEGGEDVDCPLKQITGRRSPLKILEELITIEARCLNESIDLDLTRLESLNGLAEHREFFRDLCNGRATTRQCLDAQYTKWTSCYNETMGGVFTIFADVLDSSLEKGCVDDGEGLAVITDGYHRFTEEYRAKNPFVRECIIYTTARWMMVMQSPTDLATKIWFLYKGLRSFQQCFAENIPEASLVSVSVKHMDEVLDEMKCIHPVDAKLVLCKSINSSLIDRASACPLRTRDESAIPISKMLSRRLLSCLVVYEVYGQKFSDATTLEQFGAYFNNYCRRNNRVRHCLNETTTAAEVCLHDPQLKNFNLGTDLLNNALDAGCFEQGKRLANMFYTAKSLRNNTEKQDGLQSCLTPAESANNQSIDDPTRFYQLYQELPVARQCFVDKMIEDSAYVEDVSGFINDVMANMKCIDPLNEDIVLCQTLVSN